MSKENKFYKFLYNTYPQKELNQPSDYITAHQIYLDEEKYRQELKMNSNPKQLVRRKGRNKVSVRKGKKAERSSASSAKVKVQSPVYPTVEMGLEGDSMMVSAPTSKGFIMRAGKPRLQHRVNGDCVVRNREYISDVNGSVAFHAEPFALNPGLTGSFPWLSRLAINYESYRFNSLKFMFETEASTAATGSLVLTVDYDTKDPAPTTKAQALNYRGAVRSAPWSPCVHTSLREDISKRSSYYCRNGAVPQGADSNLYDVGNLFVIVQGMASGALIGELYVEYDVLLMTPKTGDAGAGAAVWGSFIGSDNTDVLQYFGGNLPAVLSLSGPTTARLATFTFTQPWSGFVQTAAVGTGVTPAIGIIGSATITADYSIVEAGNTASAGGATVVADAFQTVILGYSNTTISSAFAWFGQGVGHSS